MALENFIVSAVLLLIAGSVAVALSKHLGMGSVLGLLVAGIIVGPHSPGPYVTTHVEEVRHFTELGVVLLLFLIGLEMRPRRLWEMRREVFGLGALQIAVTGLAIAGYMAFYQPSWQNALLVGLTLALSSTAFVLQLLQERGEIASPQGTTAFSILLMQDLAIVPLLALIPILAETGALSSDVPLARQFAVVGGMLGMVWILGRYIVPFGLEHLARQRNREGFLMIVMLAVFLPAWAMHETELSMALGAFMMGMLLSGSRYCLQIQSLVEPYKGLLMSLFFVAVGMSIDLDALIQQPWLFAQHTLAIVAIKIVVLVALAALFGVPKNVAVRLSSLLAQGGEFGFVLFGSARALRVIDDATFVTGVGVISVSMLITPLLARAGNALARKMEHGPAGVGLPRYRPDEEEPGPRVILGGYGRVGHVVATLLQTSNVPFVAFDTNPVRVAQGEKDGYPVYFGDISDPELLEAARPSDASLVVLTIDHGPTALRAVTHIRNAYPQLQVVARARDLEACGELLQAGATRALPEAIESSLRLGATALQMAGVANESVDLLLKDVRSEDYELVREEESVDPARRPSS